MDNNLFIPIQNKNEMTPGTQDIYLDLGIEDQSQVKDKSLINPCNPSQIQTPQLTCDCNNGMSNDHAKYRICQTDLNTFCISLRDNPCYKYIYRIFFYVSIAPLVSSIILYFFWKDGFVCFMIALLGIIYLLISLILYCIFYHSIYFIIEENSLTILKKGHLVKDKTIYKSGEIEKIDFQKTFDENKRSYNYKIEIFSKSKGNRVIFSQESKKELFTNEEIENFLCQINTHIETKM